MVIFLVYSFTNFNSLTFFLKKFIINIVLKEIGMSVIEKKDNKYLLEKQLETLKLFYARKLLTKEQYEEMRANKVK